MRRIQTIRRLHLGICQRQQNKPQKFAMKFLTLSLFVSLALAIDLPQGGVDVRGEVALQAMFSPVSPDSSIKTSMAESGGKALGKSEI